MLEFFIAKRMALNGEKTFSRFIIKIAVAAITLSVAVMIIAVSTVTAFQNQISEKIFGFWGHIHIKDYNANQSFEEIPINIHQPFYPSADTLENIRHIQIYALKAGILKSKNEMEGIVLKGIGKDFDWKFLKKYIVDGNFFQINDSTASAQILLSNFTANRLKLKTGDEVIIHFIQNPPRFRKLTVCGIYNTGLEEFDRIYALVDIAHIQKLNDWTKEQTGGFEIFVKDVSKLNETADFLYNNIIGQDLYAQTIKEMTPSIFDWLDLQNLNERVILILMVLVAGINMITALLILILERTNMIGILKALGAGNGSVRKIFLSNALYIIATGLLFGNLLGIGLCLLQQKFELFKLSEANYYLSSVPIELDFLKIGMLNIGTILLTLLMLLLPSYLVTKINPIKAIRWE